MNYKSVPGGVLGIIGAVFALFAAIGLHLCAEVASVVGAEQYTLYVYLLGYGGAVAALVGAIMCFNKGLIGAILETAAFVMLVILGVVMYFGFMMIVALILIGVGAILAWLVRKTA